jgi:hypothetical protein
VAVIRQPPQLLSDQELADQDEADHDDADQELADQDEADHDDADQELADQDEASHFTHAPPSQEFELHEEALNLASPLGSVETFTPLEFRFALQTLSAGTSWSSPAPDPHLHSGYAIVRSADLTASGLAPWWAARYAAAAPVVMAVASLVPEPRNNPNESHASGLRVAIRLFGAISPRTCTPGATRSGLTGPSTVARPENHATFGRPTPVLAAPTVSTCGSRPGSPI